MTFQCIQITHILITESFVEYKETFSCLRHIAALLKVITFNVQPAYPVIYTTLTLGEKVA